MIKWKVITTIARMTVSLALDLLCSWVEARNALHDTVHVASGSADNVGWRKPISFDLKYNVDAAIFSDDNAIGIGMV